jgi:pyruvate/2-oxoglutarate dehydrogenase complex dihydrolipoamide dehydrogenase (E3) component
MKDFDAIIVGTGQAGPPLAGRLTAAGMSVAIIERKHVGGTCVNTGCMPTKALVASAYAAHLTRRASDFGIELEGVPTVDMPKVMARSHQVTLNARKNNRDWLQSMEKCRLIEGHARFESRHVIRVGEELLRAPRIFLNVGGRAAIPDFPGVDQVPYLTNSSIVLLERVPRHLVIVGGSYIGLEFAQMYRRFGAEVTVIEKGERLIGREDHDVSDAITRDPGGGGHPGNGSGPNAFDWSLIRMALPSAWIAVKAHRPSSDRDVLMATGRRPNTDDLGLDTAGVEVDDHGYIKIGDDLATTAEGIWALGDCNGKGAFTHTAYNDFEIVAANLLDGEDRRVSDRILGYALYIDPPPGARGDDRSSSIEGGKEGPCWQAFR